MMPTLKFLLLGYLSGSILYARVFSALLGRGDITARSPDRNPGTANAFQYGGFLCGALTLLCDIGKGFLPVHLLTLSAWQGETFPLLTALAIAAPVLGHAFPLFYGFRGGKGVLCAETMLLIVSFPTGLVSLLIFVGIVWATRYVSLGSICGALIAPIGVLAACGKLPALLSLFCVILLVVKHRSNIGRLIRHKESKLSFKKDLSDKFDDEDF